ncbi:hypothetical protein D1007_20599 [Hordeum vulgare]|nr:hypothetical protein D1007_20599 [Hordeum vulgare]
MTADAPAIGAPGDGAGASYAELYCELVKELEGATKKVDDILEEECCELFFLAVTRHLSHLLRCDPRFKFDEVMGPMPEESCGNLVPDVDGHMNILLGKFFYSDGEEPPVIILK